eukprot:scpid51842/ scgid34756/ 
MNLQIQQNVADISAAKFESHSLFQCLSTAAMDGLIRDRSGDVDSESDLQDVLGYPKSDSGSEPVWDNDLARATGAAVSRKRSLSRTSAQKSAVSQSAKRSRSAVHGGSTTVNTSPA